MSSLNSSEPTNLAHVSKARAILYIRVSTKDQAKMGGEIEGYSIPAQREAAHRKAASLGAEVIGEFVERGESAKTADRPSLASMMQWIAENDVDYLIVHKVDRLARNRADDVSIHMALKARGITLVSVSENIDETPSGMLLHGIMSSIAEFYSLNLAQEVVKGSVQKAKAGGTPGKAPTGYLNVRVVENGREVRTVHVDPVRGPLMAWAFEAYATGEWTTRRLLAEVTERGLTSIPGPKTPGKRLGLANFHRLLTNPYYKGIVTYRGVQYQGKHEPLVSEDIWDKVQATLKAKGRAGEKQREHHHYLKGTVFCGQCESRLIVSHAVNRHGTTYAYFICLGRQQKRTNCTQKAVLISTVEDLVIQHYRTVQPTPAMLDSLRSFILGEMDSQKGHADKERAHQQRRVRALHDERKKLLDLHYADAIPVELVKEEQTRIAADLKEAERRLVAVDVKFETVESNLSSALKIAGNWAEAYRTAGATVRRQMNHSIFEKIWIDDEGSVTSQLAEPFELLLDTTTLEAARLDSDRKTAEQAGTPLDVIDAAWATLSARWEAEERGRRSELNGLDANCAVASTAELCTGVGFTTQESVEKSGKTKPSDLLGPEGLKYALLVGAEGLEPTTSAL